VFEGDPFSPLNSWRQVSFLGDGIGIGGSVKSIGGNTGGSINSSGSIEGSSDW
jgi:hypothetical protein